MAGLLSSPGIRLSGLLGPQQAMSQALMASNRENQALKQAQQAPAPAPAPQQRGRASGLRVMDNFLFGEGTIGQSLDQERARQQSLVDAPIQRQYRQNAIESISDPRERALFLGMGGDSWQENVGKQFAPQVVGAGSIQSVIGSGQAVGAPDVQMHGDTLGIINPITKQWEPLNTRGPTISETLNRDKLNADIANQRGTLSVAQQNADTGQYNAQTTRANSGFSLGQGQQRFDAQGNPIAAVAPSVGAGSGKITEGQAKDGFNAGRMNRAGAIVAGMEGGGFDYGLSTITGGQLREEGRQYEAAAEEWTDSLLRMTTGAAATKDEIRNAMKAYFPQPGDSAAVRNQKAQMRASVEQDAITRAGPGYAQQGGIQGGVVSVQTPQEAAALPAGTVYRTPDGRQFRR